jgi:hypothetical protein
VYVQLVFDTWRESTMRTAPARMSSRQRQLLQQAIERHGLDVVKDAVVAWRYSRSMCGDNHEGKVTFELEPLLVDADRIQRAAERTRRARERGEDMVQLYVRDGRLSLHNPARRGIGNFQGVRVLS